MRNEHQNNLLFADMDAYKVFKIGITTSMKCDIPISINMPFNALLNGNSCISHNA